MQKILVVSGVMVAFFSGAAWAQSKQPLLGVDHLVRIEMVRKLQDAAQQACQQLSVTRNYVEAQRQTTQAIEQEYKGWTLNWATLQLVPQAAEGKNDAKK